MTLSDCIKPPGASPPNLQSTMIMFGKLCMLCYAVLRLLCAIVLCCCKCLRQTSHPCFCVEGVDTKAVGTTGCQIQFLRKKQKLLPAASCKPTVPGGWRGGRGNATNSSYATQKQIKIPSFWSRDCLRQQGSNRASATCRRCQGLRPADRAASVQMLTAKAARAKWRWPPLRHS